MADKTLNSLVGGNGLPINSLMPIVNSPAKVILDDGTEWLRTGFVETDLESYPDADITYANTGDILITNGNAIGRNSGMTKLLHTDGYISAGGEYITFFNSGYGPTKNIYVAGGAFSGITVTMDHMYTATGTSIEKRNFDGEVIQAISSSSTHIDTDGEHIWAINSTGTLYMKKYTLDLDLVETFAITGPAYLGMALGDGVVYTAGWNSTNARIEVSVYDLSCNYLETIPLTGDGIKGQVGTFTKLRYEYPYFIIYGLYTHESSNLSVMYYNLDGTANLTYPFANGERLLWSASKFYYYRQCHFSYVNSPYKWELYVGYDSGPRLDRTFLQKYTKDGAPLWRSNASWPVNSDEDSLVSATQSDTHFYAATFLYGESVAYIDSYDYITGGSSNMGLSAAKAAVKIAHDGSVLWVTDGGYTITPTAGAIEGLKPFKVLYEHRLIVQFCFDGTHFWFLLNDHRLVQYTHTGEYTGRIVYLSKLLEEMTAVTSLMWTGDSFAVQFGTGLSNGNGQYFKLNPVVGSGLPTTTDYVRIK